MRLIAKQTDSAAKNANLRQCTPQPGISAYLFSMPDLVKTSETHLCLNQEDKISYPTMQSNSHLQSGYQSDYRIQQM